MQQDNMKLNSEISLGNMVSWGMILVGFGVGYATLQATARDAVRRAEIAETKAELAESKISGLTTDIAVIKTTVVNIEKKVDEVRLNNRVATNIK